MLFILDKSHEVVGSLNSNGDLSKITTYFDDKYVQDLGTGAETFTFSTLADNEQSQHLVAGNFIAFKEDGEFKLFSIIQIEETHEDTFIKTVYCEMAGIELINEIIRPMKVLNSSLRKFLTTILEGTEWQLGRLDAGFTQVHDFEITEYKSVYELIQEHAVGTYGAEISYRVEIAHGRIVGKYIDCYQERGNANGFRFAYRSNLTSVVRTVDMSNLATALIGVGKNGLTFKSVETGDKPLNQDFIENKTAYKQWNINGSHIFGVHKEETESPQELLRLTRLALEERSNPQIKYEMKAELLGKDVKIGDTVAVIDHEFNPPLYLSARVNQLTKSKTDPYNDEVVLANFKEVRSNITNEMRQLASQLEGYVDNQFPIGGDKIQDGAIGKQQFSKTYHTEIVADAVHASLVETEDLIAGKANIGDLQAINATIENLKAENVEITGNLSATNAQIESLKANKADIDSLNALEIKVNTIDANKANISDLNAVNATIGTLQANKADIVELNAVKGDITHLNSEVAKIGTLQADVADIDHILAGNITAENIQTGAITAGSGIIADGAIGSAQISYIDAGKISAGKIDTSKVEVAGADGHLRIKGNRLQVFNGIGNQAKERVSLGDVNGNGTVYGLRVRGADGTTILLDENGVKPEGITDGSITNNKISDDANIDGAKLNINSVVSKINEDGTETIQGTKIEVDGTTLNAKLSTITNKQTQDSERITQAQSQITANTNAIKLKVDEQTYQTDKQNMNSQLEKHTSEIGVMKDEINIKVEQTDINKAVDGVREGFAEDIGALNKRIDDVLEDIGGAVIEGALDEAKCDIIQNTISQLNKEKAQLLARFEYIYSMSDLDSATKTKLTKAKDTYVSTVERLIATINRIIADKHISPSEKTEYDTQVAEYSTSLTALVKVLEESLQSITNSKINTTKAEIKVTTDTISQNVSNLSQTVSTKADGSTVTAINNKVGSLETSVNGISGKVTNLEKTTTNLGNSINGVQGEVDTLKSDVASLEVTTSGISQKVSSVESTTASLSSEINGVKGNVSNLTSRVSNAESKLTKDSLTTTIGSHYTTSTDVNGIVDKKGYATTSQVQQTVDGLQVKVQQSGGYNLLYNGDFKRGFDKWNNNGAVKLTTLSCPSNQTGVKFAGELNTTKHIGQTVSCDFQEPFTVSFWQYTSASGENGTTNPFRRAEVVVTYTDDTKAYYGTNAQTNLDKWEKISATVYPTKRVKSLSVTLYNRDTTRAVYYTNIMLEKGSMATEYSPNPNEIHDGITTIDKDGITVTASNVKSKTNMSANGFKITKTDTNEDVFKVNADGTLYMKGQITVTGGSVPTSNLTGTIASSQLNSSITTDITNAKNNASSALSTANTASTNASNAVSTANTAKSTADSAKSTADSAKSTADSVNTTVNNNKSNWSNAYNRVKEWANGAVTGSTSINGGMIATNTITAEKIAVADFNNYCTLPFNRTAGGANGGTYQCYYIDKDNLNHSVFTNKLTSIKQGDKFRITGTLWCATASQGISVVCCMRDISGALLSSTSATYKVTTASSYENFSLELTVPSIPTGFSYAGIKVQLTNDSNPVWLYGLGIHKMASAELIVDGAISANKIASNAITANKIASNAITGSKIHADAINGKTIVGATLKGGTFFTAPNASETDGYAFRIYDDGRVYSKNTIQVYGTAGNNVYAQLKNGVVTATEYMQTSGYKTENSTMRWGINDVAVANPNGDNANRLEFTTIDGNRYFRPCYNGTVRSGSTSYPWYSVYSKNGVSTTSDRTMKENIRYIDRAKSDCFEKKEMYDFIKDDYALAQYNYINDTEEKISAIAQDLLVNMDGSDNRIGQLIVNNEEAIKLNEQGENAKLSINQTQLLNVAIGALQETMKKVEMLEKEIEELKRREVTA